MCKIKLLWLAKLMSYRAFSSFNQNGYMGSRRGYHPISPILTDQRADRQLPGFQLVSSSSSFMYVYITLYLARLV